jgi:hypothetical protein
MASTCAPAAPKRTTDAKSDGSRSDAIDALCVDSKRGEGLSQDLENRIGVLSTKGHRDEAAQLCGHKTAKIRSHKKIVSSRWAG